MTVVSDMQSEITEWKRIAEFRGEIIQSMDTEIRQLRRHVEALEDYPS